MEFILLCVIFVIEITKYSLAYYLFWGTGLRKQWKLLFLVPFFSLVPYIQRDSFSFHYLLTYLMVVAGVFMLQESAGVLDKIIKTGILFFFASGTDAVLGRCMDGIWGKAEIPFHMDILVESSIVILILLLLSFARNKLVLSFGARKGVTKYGTILIIVLALEILMAISGLSFSLRYVEDGKLHKLLSVLCIVAYSGIGTMGLMLLYVRHTNKIMSETVEQERRLQNMQRKYYESLIEREQDTRKFRHDLVNHLIILEKMAEENKAESVQQYVVQMNQNLQKVVGSVYVTGTHILDVLTGYYVSKLPDYVNLSIVGRAVFELDEVLLCSAYGNLLQNAVEELELCEQSGSLSIGFTQGENYGEIKICNSIAEKHRGLAEKDFWKTKKGDYDMHGMGIASAQNAVKNMRGKLNIVRDETQVTVTLILPLRVTV